jgi:NADH:ubiquinone oxidoreductase subunit F (NADH-binding)
VTRAVSLFASNGRSLSGVPRLLPSERITAFDDHLARFGSLPTIHSRSERTDLIDAVERSGLRGRGGAGFPTGRKLRTVAHNGRRTVVVANGAEGEPASHKDAVLLSSAPHLVIDGAVASARAVRAAEVFIVVDRAKRAVHDVVADAVAQRAGTHGDVAVELVAVPSRYVAGEESAVVNFLNGGPSKPRSVPPRPFERGVRGRPTLVQNVETLANIALIARFGVDWFQSVGPLEEPGTLLVTVCGAVASPGVYEFALGTPMRAVLDASGGPSRDLRALLVGGYFGSWLPAGSLEHLELTHRSLHDMGGTLGCGMIAVLPNRVCGVAESARVARYLAQETAGQCGPCVHGLSAIADAVESIATSRARPGTLAQVQRWLQDVAHRGACHLPDASVGFLSSALRVFAEDFALHEHGKQCARSHVDLVLPLPDRATRDWSWM